MTNPNNVFKMLIGVAMLSVASTTAFADGGEKIYTDNCKACHSSDFVKAPKLGKKDDWKDRLGKGKETLVQSVIKGMTGKNGVMPPRGGNPKLSDEDLAAAVQYIIDASK